MPGAVGGQNHLSIMETQKPDVILVGECPEWETVEYMRDSQFFGRKTALVILGHGLSEAPGMEYFAEWLKPKVPDLKVHYLPFKDPFTWV
jgi:putative NIF3 family GTP cyclohydrolase 1 type 2